jgi:hypothetical protein
MPADSECPGRNVNVGCVQRKSGDQLLLLADAFPRGSDLRFRLSQVPFEGGSIHARQTDAVSVRSSP